jgi:ATP synthase F1 delta subunit
MKLRSTKTLAEAIHEVTRGKSGAELSLAMSNVVEFMNKNQLLGKSKEILSHLENIIDKEDKVIRAKVSSAQVLDKKDLEELSHNLKKRYKAETIKIDTHENKDLVNGIKVEVSDEIIDLTLAHRLHQLQTHLTKN